MSAYEGRSVGCFVLSIVSIMAEPRLRPDHECTLQLDSRIVVVFAFDIQQCRNIDLGDSLLLLCHVATGTSAVASTVSVCELVGLLATQWGYRGTCTTAERPQILPTPTRHPSYVNPVMLRIEQRSTR